MRGLGERRKRLPPMLDYLESQTPAHRFRFGEFGMADFSIVSPFINASYAGYECWLRVLATRLIIHAGRRLPG